MTLADHWIAEYGNMLSGNGRAAPCWLYVPIAVMSFVGLLWHAPVPREFIESTPTLNWGALFLMATVVYYFIVSISLALGVLPFVVAVVVALSWLDQFEQPLWPICGAVFLVAWLGQGTARWMHGHRPAYFKELQLLMIGPIWLLARLYRKLGIPY